MFIFYQQDLSGNEIFLSEEESKHAVRVLRLKKGDHVQLVDGKGGSVIASILDDHPKKSRLGDFSASEIKKPSRKYELHIAVAPTKNSDRMEWFIEKAVEAGIDEISFIACENSERAKINMERFEKVAVSAMKQSKQLWLPKINPLADFSDLVGEARPGTKLIAWCETPAQQDLHAHITGAAGEKILVCVGPEGDFAKQEIDLAMKHDFRQVSFGESRLRTETAALYACMAIHALSGKP